MNLIFTLFVFAQLTICDSTTLDGREFDGNVRIEDGFGTPFKQIQKRTANGFRGTVQRLISKAQRVYSRSSIASNFEINGDLEKAFRDFYSFDPMNVKSYEEGLRTGWAGDRYLSLRTNKGGPILAVIDWKKKGQGQGRYIYRFIYKKSVEN